MTRMDFHVTIITESPFNQPKWLANQIETILNKELNTSIRTVFVGIKSKWEMYNLEAMKRNIAAVYSLAYMAEEKHKPTKKRIRQKGTSNGTKFA